jgi:hypothetical protein
MTGQCKGDLSTAGAPAPQGLRYWLMIADNSRDGATHEATPDIVGFAVHDRNGNRVAYGTGPVKSGDFKVTPK